MSFLVDLVEKWRVVPGLPGGSSNSQGNPSTFNQKGHPWFPWKCPFTISVLGQGSPKKDRKREGTLILSSLLEDLVHECGNCLHHRCPFWLIWLKNGGWFLAYLVVQSTTREAHLFSTKGTPMVSMVVPFHHFFFGAGFP